MKSAQIVFLAKTALAISFFGAIASIAQQDQEVLDNQAVIAMVKAHLAEENIVTQIQISPGRYNLSSSSIIHLAQMGVPKSVIAAMQAKAGAQGNESDAASRPESKSERSTASVPGRWQIRDSIDQMTDRHVRYAESSVAGDPSGKFTVKATCSDDSMLTFLFVNKSRDQALLRSHQSQCVDMKLRVVKNQDDQGDAQDVTSQYCELPNVALVNFIGNSATISRRSVDQTESALKTMFAGIPTEHPEVLPKVGEALDGMFREFTERNTEVILNVAGVPRMRDVIGASSMRVGFPFTDGGFSVIRLDLQQFEFQKYVRQCVAGEPDDPGGGTADTEGTITRQFSIESLSASGELHRKLTTDEFAQLLPEALKRAEDSHQLPPRNYDLETKRILALVDACDSLGRPLAGGLLKDCSGPDYIDVSHSPIVDAPQTKSAPRGDILLRFAPLQDSAFGDVGAIVTLTANNFQSHLMRTINLQSSRDKSGPRGWVAPNDPMDPSGVQSPHIDDYGVAPTWVPVGADVRIMYTVYSKAPENSPVRAYLLRAPDLAGRPGPWETIAQELPTLSSGLVRIEFHDTAIQAGKYWYRTRVFDGRSLEAKAPPPFLVRVAPEEAIEQATPDAPDGLFPGGTEVVLGALIGREPPPQSPDLSNDSSTVVVATTNDAGKKLKAPPPQRTASPPAGSQSASDDDRACTVGNLEGCNHLGWDYFYGKGIAQDENRAVEIWTRACDAGNGGSCFAVGFFYNDGMNDAHRAMPFFVKGCDAGEGSSCFALGEAYRTGSGVDRDLQKAGALYDRACSLDVKAGCTHR